MSRRSHRDPALRLAPFLDAGLLARAPTTWQLLLGQAEMAPYVVLPDAGDRSRYAGAPLGHPLLRTPVVLARIGPEHLRIGHGLHASLRALVEHLCYVHHEGMPVYDLQLVQTLPGGLDRLRRRMACLQRGDGLRGALERRLVGLVVAEADRYRDHFLAPGGWIDRAAAFDFPQPQEIAPFLRPEFTSLVAFADYCERTFPRAPEHGSPHRELARLGRLLTRRFRDPPGIAPNATSVSPSVSAPGSAGSAGRSPR